MNELSKALNNTLYKHHKISDKYLMDGKPDRWEIVYYPIFECGKTGEKYNEPRALVQNIDKGGFWHKEVPLRYLTKIMKT